MPPLPETPHELALWLLEHLEGVASVGNGAWEGVLPSQWDFREITRRVESSGRGFGGICDEDSRTIEFYPHSVGVYESMAEFFDHPANLRSVPRKFTIRELSYTFEAGAPQPALIENYLAATKLCEILSKASDHQSDNGNSQHFIKSHDAKIEVRLIYEIDDLTPLPSINDFEDEFIKNSHHKDQKRSIIRSTLLEIFKGRRIITVGDIIKNFGDFSQNARSSYVMYTADFSYEKIRTEVEKQNLEDAVRLNKTVSEIQNQLLALPAALVLAGAGIDEKSAMKNWAIWIGITIFGWMMWKLINNQLHSVGAIEKEIEFREGKLSEQPDMVASRFSGTFTQLKNRVSEQKRVLNGIRWVVAVIWVVVSVMSFSVLYPEWSIEIRDFFNSLTERLPVLWYKFWNCIPSFPRNP